MEELRPDHLKGDEFKLSSAGSSRDVKALERRSGDRYTIDLRLHDETYDTETYVVREGSFSLESGAGEVYDPPIPILKFPMTVGDHWQWSGTAAAGDEPMRATAKIATTKESLFVCDLSFESVESTVELSLPTQDGLMIERKMTFYFAPGQGLFKREFGATSIREPACN
jgi:hypothetical protein